MLSPKIYTLENVGRIKYAQMVVIGISAVICGYLMLTSVLSMREIWTAGRSLHREQKEYTRITREMKRLNQVETTMQPLTSGGVELFAVQFSQLAGSRGLKVESLVPEGAPTATDITVNNEKLGSWNASKVRVQGYGDFSKLMNLLKELGKPQQPAKLESIALQSSESSNGTVRFDIVLTVYEKKSEAS